MSFRVFSRTKKSIKHLVNALIEAIQRGNWLEAALFLALGALSLRADFKK